MRKLFIYIILFSKIVLLAQDENQFGEKEFNEEKEGATFTVYDEQKSPKIDDSIDLAYMMPPVGDQGKKKACWAWATTYVIRTVMDNPDFSSTNTEYNAKLYSPEYTYQYYKGDKDDCNWEALSHEMLSKILKDGAVKYSDLKYDENICNIKLEKNLIEKAKLNARDNYEVERLYDLFSIKKILAEKQPLIISIRIDDYFSGKTNGNWNINEKSPYWFNYGRRKSPHAMVIVGYNNRRKAFKVLNSWGKKFGLNGYVWISYSIVENFMQYSCYPKKIKSTEMAIENVSKEKTVSAESSAKPSDKKTLTAWFKTGYFINFDSLRIGLAGLDENKKFGLVNISDTNGVVQNSFYIDINSSKEFYVNGKKYEFKFDDIIRRGLNPLKKAMEFTISDNSSKDIKIE